MEEVAQRELTDHAQRNLERLLTQARLGRFRPIADFDWSWPKKIDRLLIERALSLEFIQAQRNLILLGTNGLGKIMIAKNIAYAAVQAGHRVHFRTASEILTDLACDSPQLRRRKFNSYARPALLVLDEVGYLAYDAAAADLLYEVVNRRYERCSMLITSNRAFKTWNEVFPNATCIATLLDRLTRYADITTIESKSYRPRESEQAAAARQNQPYVDNEMTERAFMAQVLSFYLRLPQTPTRTSRTDRQLAAQWFAQGQTWEPLEGALLLATVRRCLRDHALPPLSPIRSLHYFVPLLEEVQATPLAPEYVQYLRSKLAAFITSD